MLPDPKALFYALILFCVLSFAAGAGAMAIMAPVVFDRCMFGATPAEGQQP